MHIVSWNVNGVRAIAGKNLYSVIENLNPDILCLQETKATAAQTQEVFDNVKGYYCYAHEASKKGYSGVAIATKKKPLSVTYGIGMEEHDDEGRVITAEFATFYLVSGYIPNSGDGMKRLDYRVEWDKAFLNYLKALESIKPVIATGDFNVAHKPIDLARPKENYNKTSGYTQKEIDGMDAFTSNGFVDAYRLFRPEEVKYSFWSARFGARVKNIGWRIDYFLVSADLADKCLDSVILDEIMGSDHCPISLHIASK